MLTNWRGTKCAYTVGLQLRELRRLGLVIDVYRGMRMPSLGTMDSILIRPILKLKFVSTAPDSGLNLVILVIVIGRACAGCFKLDQSARPRGQVGETL